MQESGRGYDLAGYLSGYSSLNHLAEFAFQVARLVLMDNTPFYEFIDLAHYIRKCCGSIFTFQGFQVPDGITCCFTVVTVPVPAFAGLTHIFFRCLVICHNAMLY